MFLMYGDLDVTEYPLLSPLELNLNAYPVLFTASNWNPVTVKSSIVTSPFKIKASFVFVGAVGWIVTALKPSPFNDTPTGTTIGNTSEYVPGYMWIWSPVVATDNAFVKLAYGSFWCVPVCKSSPFVAT